MARDAVVDSSEKDHTYAMEEVPTEKTWLAGTPEHLHEAMKAGLSREDAEFLHSVGKVSQKKIFHKVDWRLCPMLAVLYLISHLDRANIGYIVPLLYPKKRTKHQLTTSRSKATPRSKGSKRLSV